MGVDSSGRKHLLTSQDWTLGDIDETLELTKRLRDGSEPDWVKDCLARGTVTLLFNKPSTRSRILFHFATVQMGGVPLSLDESNIHPGEDWTELCTTLVQSEGALCVRLLPTEKVPYGKGEPLLRQLAAISDANDGPRPPVISMSHDRCHPCQGLYELLTYREAMDNKLVDKRILITWMRGNRDAPASPTQDSLMMMTRMGMKVTLCHPPGRELDSDVMNICRQNTRESGGEFVQTSDLHAASLNQNIIYARHWGAPAMGNDVSEWYCDRKMLGDAKYIHPMPVDRGVEASEEVVNGPNSLIHQLIHNKHFVQKAVLARLINLRSV